MSSELKPKGLKYKKYKDKNVLDAARERIAFIFDEFKDINVSISSGKDSCVLYHLVLQEAQKRDRKFVCFFLDQEAEYAATIEVIKIMMKNKHVIPAWYQVPIYMTNATSYSDYFLYAWGENEKWIREKEKDSIKEIKEAYPRRFYDFFGWYENQNPKAAYLVGLRADESLTRYRAVTKTPGYKGLRWSTLTDDISKFYPIYDWTVYDVWKFIYDFDIKYNKIYDLMWLNNHSIYSKMRVSNLIHEKSYKCLVDLPRFEPETYDKLCKRIGGIATAARYASEKLVFSNKKLPAHYKTWKEFRDFLLFNIPNPEHQKKFIDRFNKQEQNEKTYQKQCGQLLINDYESNKSFDTQKSKKVVELKKKWWDIL